MEWTLSSITLLIGICTISMLICMVIFLSWRLLRLKRRSKDYEVMQNSQRIILPKNGMRIKHIPIAISHANHMPEESSSTTDSSSSKGDSTIKSTGDSPVSKSKDFPHKELLSLAKYHIGNSHATESETDLLSHLNVKDESEASKFHALKEVPAIEFKLVYDTQNLTLKVNINRVSNLPVQFRKNCSSYVKISLSDNSEKLGSHHTNVIKKSLNPEFNEEFEFSQYSFEYLKPLTIRLSVYAKRKQLSKRQLVGDLHIPLSRPDFEPDTELICNERISVACLRTGKRGPLMMAGELGFVYIQLQYQPEAERLKVFVKKGQNISNKTGHSTNIQLTNSDKAVAYKETKTAVGSSPVWNQSFIFNLPESSSKEYFLQLLVMKGKLYLKDDAIGQILIGGNTNKSGNDHWNDIFWPKYLEPAKWHEITHIGTHCF